MSNPSRLSREQLLEAMDIYWGRYLPTLEGLPEDERQAFAEGEGYADVKALVAHFCYWFQRTADVVTTLAAGLPYPTDDRDTDTKNRDAVAAYANQSFDAVKQDYDNLRTHLAGIIAELPDAVFQNQRVYDWLYETVIAHYQEHIPPGEPQNPAETYGGVRP